MAAKLTQRKIDALESDFQKLLFELKNPSLTAQLTPQKKTERRRQAAAGRDAWLKVYWGHIMDSEPNRLHLHIDALTEEQRPGIHPIRAFRKAGKSARAYLNALYEIVHGHGGLILFALRNMDKSEARVDALVRLLLSNRALCYDYDINIQQSRSGHHIINNTHLIAASYKTGLRSIMDDEFGRIRLAILDDLYDRTSVTSELDNQRVIQFVVDEVHGQMEADGCCIVFGNDITHDSPIRKLADMYPENAFSLPALDDAGSSTWPERYDDQYWTDFRKTCDFVVWTSQYMLQPAVRGEVWQPEWLRTVNISTLDIIAVVTSCDPARGESPNSSYKGLMTVGVTSSRETVLLDAYLRREPLAEIFDYVQALRERFPTWKVLTWENDFEQWDFARRDYQDWQKRTGINLPLHIHYTKEVAGGGDKLSRILTLEHPMRTGTLRISDDISSDGQQGNDDYMLLRDQLLAVGATTKKLDGPDALATAYSMVWRYLSIQEGGLVKSHRTRIHRTPEWLGGGFHG